MKLFALFIVVILLSVLIYRVGSAWNSDLKILQGQVVRVLDGDTLYIRDAGHQVQKLRLAGINAPEKGEPYSDSARDFLWQRAHRRFVTFYWYKTDKYERKVGKLVIDDQDVNLALLKEGLAVWYRRFAKEQQAVDRMLYEQAEQKARKRRLGIWGHRRYNSR